MTFSIIFTYRILVKTIIDYYCNSTIEHPRLRFVLYTVFYSMVDAYVDDEDEFKRLINMIKVKATPEEPQESRLITQMRESLVNLASKHERLIREIESLTIENERLIRENKRLTIENERLIRENKRLTIENEVYRGIQEILDNHSDDLPDHVKSSLQKLLFKKSINH